MTESNAPRPDPTGPDAAPAEPTLFSALLTPHRSLGSVGFVVLMSVVAAISFAGGVVFYLVGAWPVGGFFGLDALLIYWAFRVNYRAAQAYEEVTVTPSELRVKKVTHKGTVSEWTLNPLWTSLDRDVHEEFGLMKLSLVSRGKRLAVATFLGPAEKETFAAALSVAIGEAKRGPTRNPL
jgi:uncharacterized membrane protein